MAGLSKVVNLSHEICPSVNPKFFVGDGQPFELMREAMRMDTDTKAKLVFAVYCVVGLPIVWLHMRQQKMVKPTRQIQLAQVQGLVVYTLAAIWPLLLFSMLLTYLQRKTDNKSFKAKSDDLSVDDN